MGGKSTDESLKAQRFPQYQIVSGEPMRKKLAGNISNPDSLKQIEKEFSDYADSIHKLLTFDDFVVKDALNYFDDPIQILERNFPQNPALDKLRMGRKSVSNIREHGSLKPFYKVIYNQTVVICVSVLAATLESVFRYLIGINYPSLPARKKDRKISIGELLEVVSFEKPKEAFADIVRKADDSISFQDIGSIRRTFGDYFDIHFEDDSNFHNVAFAIKARHAIVHNGGRIDANFRRYAKDKLTKRTVMKNSLKSPLQFELAEAKKLLKSLVTFVHSLISAAREKQMIEQKQEEDLPF